MKRIILILMVLLMGLSALPVMAKKEVVRQLGGACGENSDMIASCASGTSCKNGTCQMDSFLSPATKGCKQAMQDKGVDPKTYVAAHDGFCYIDSDCRGLYEQAMSASSVTPKLLKSDNSIDAFALAELSPEDFQTFQRAINTCKQCGHCVIGRQFLGRGGY